MHICFVHQNFPAQFGHVARALIDKHGHRCTFVSEQPAGMADGLERLQFKLEGGATPKNHYCSRTFENCIWQAHAVYETLKARPDIKPDLIVGHSGLGCSLFLRELYRCPIINYFEYFYHTVGSDMDFRADFPSSDLDRLRARARNAMLLLDLHNCDRGYSPTQWQRSRLPREFQDKVQVIFDGIDTNLWKPQPKPALRVVGKQVVPDGVKIITYAARGFESMRGFDMFMKIAKQLCDQRRDVVFAVAGQDRICYGGDQKIIGGPSFKDWVLKQDKYDLSRIHFVGLLPPQELAQLLAMSDLHIYLTVPFVLSWSLMNALACGCTVLASATPPVEEMIKHRYSGLLADFFDLECFVSLAHQVLDHPDQFKALGEAGAKMIREKYSLEVCLPQMVQLYQEIAAGKGGGRPESEFDLPMVDSSGVFNA
jgi:glycosyltransferase involved in cell wall biosynthesis